MTEGKAHSDRLDLTTSQGCAKMESGNQTTTKEPTMAKQETTETVTTCQCNAIPVDAEKHIYEACGTPISKRATFAPGHDAKLKSVLIRCHRDEAKYKVQVEGRKAPLVLDPADVAAERSWTKFLTDKPAPKKRVRKAKAERPAKAEAEADAEVEAPKVDLLAEAVVEEDGTQVAFTIGRTTYEGVILSRSKDGSSVEVEYETKGGATKTKVLDADVITELTDAA